MGASSSDDRATRASPQAPAGLDHPASIPCAYGAPVATVAEMEELDSADVLEGYLDGLNDEPEPTGNRSKGYWHGWRNGMTDKGRRPLDGAQAQLAREVVGRAKK